MNATNTNAITQTPIKPTSTQFLPFFDPSFLAQCKAFENFFLPSDTLLTLPILLQAQKDDTVLSIVYKWLKQKQRPHSLTPVIKAISFFYDYYGQFQHYILTQTHILFNIIHLILESLEKSLSKLNLLLIKLAYVYHLNSFMLLLIKLILVVTLVKNSLLKRLTNSITFSSSFMVL